MYIRAKQTLTSDPKTVEISGFSHFFGFGERRPLRFRVGEAYEYLKNSPKWHMGMAFAQNRPDEASILAARY
ncbi:MAG TPA: hypothetical protein VFT48_01790 [Pyrinomonadaceae bacterium]|nr:hypothetical protein [Pyrinomonadaceae bacterium]